ncbi:hypothetical protein [Dyella amyloliquefaciens]|uniref:hypothetical protein n=1 Tax=Dyella amyloliquefaciens TaxID=1770545 RepID=UPI00102E6F36|nr:hypothetical protein [Dyella amyloliquefaciens]
MIMKSFLAKSGCFLAMAMLSTPSTSIAAGQGINAKHAASITVECRNDVCCYFDHGKILACSDAPVIEV